MNGYPLNQVHQEVAFLGRWMHWGLNEVLDLDHAQRRRWVEEAAALADEEPGDDRWA
jgi:hypothetical protein